MLTRVLSAAEGGRHYPRLPRRGAHCNPRSSTRRLGLRRSARTGTVGRMGVRVGIDTGGTFTDLVAVDEASGRWYVAKVPSNPANPVAAISAALGTAGFDPADVDVRRRRHHDRHQRRADPQRRARALSDDQGLRGRALHPADQPQAPLRLPLAQARAADAPPRLPARRRAASTRRAACSSRSTSRGSAIASPSGSRERRRARRGRGVPALLLPQPRSRASDARAAARALSRPAGLALARDRADLARVRARHDDGGRRVHQAALRALRGRRLDGARRAGRGRRAGRC